MKADDHSTERRTVRWSVGRYVAGRTDITEKAQQQYEWAIPHIENGLGASPVATLDREAVVPIARGAASRCRGIDALATGGRL